MIGSCSGCVITPSITIVAILLPSFLLFESITISNSSNICNHAVVVVSEVIDVPVIITGNLAIGSVADVVVITKETCFDSPLLNETELGENSISIFGLSSILVLSCTVPSKPPIDINTISIFTISPCQVVISFCDSLMDKVNSALGTLIPIDTSAVNPPDLPFITIIASPD